ncbi:MAG: hypothetical protein RRC34_08420 [Lentisphaeria bacterium]|nr:hypothetical protein [Lentisphaeria bacterium]
MKNARTKPGFLGIALAIVATLALTGCQCFQADSNAAPAPTRVKAAEPTTNVHDGMMVVSRALPTYDMDTSAVLLESASPVEVMVGQEFPYTISATNLTDYTLVDVVVTEMIKDPLHLKGSAPQAQMSGAQAAWNLGSLEAGETKTITTSLAASAPGQHKHCASVTYRQIMCQTVTVVAPELKLTKDMPDMVLICNDIPVTLVASNTGTGTIKNVTVTDTLPSGLLTTDGKQQVSFTIPQLDSGESETMTFTAKAQRTGTFKNVASANSAAGLTADASATVVVRQPILTIDKTGTEEQYAGRPVSYKIVVANTGDADAKDLVITDQLPAGVTLLSASQGGLAAADGTVSWKVSSLPPGKSVTVGATVRADRIGLLENVASAKANCAKLVIDKAVTKVVGVPAVLLEVVDVEDPISVGDTETYVITVTNQGTADDTNIVITCTLEDTQSYVSSSGATTGRVAGQTVTFAPLAALGPKQQATWKVVVKAEKAGDVRFKVNMTTDILGRPVEETEATNQY